MGAGPGSIRQQNTRTVAWAAEGFGRSRSPAIGLTQVRCLQRLLRSALPAEEGWRDVPDARLRRAQEPRSGHLRERQDHLRAKGPRGRRRPPARRPDAPGPDRGIYRRVPAPLSRAARHLGLAAQVDGWPDRPPVAADRGKVLAALVTVPGSKALGGRLATEEGKLAQLEAERATLDDQRPKVMPHPALIARLRR